MTTETISRPRPPGRLATLSTETKVNIVVLVSLGMAGFVGSASHVLELAESNGQRGVGAWTVVGTVEVLAAYSGWQVTRREGWRRWVALATLTLATAFTIGANLAATEAGHRTVWGYTIAVTPAAIFIAAVVLAETSERPSRAAAKAAKRDRKAKASAVTVATTPAPSLAMAMRSPEPVATVAKPQVEPQVGVAKTDPKEAVLAAMRPDIDMGMGEIIMATGLARSTAKKAVADLRAAGRLTTFGDASKPRYLLATDVAVEAAEVAR